MTTKDIASKKNILFVEQNQDGTVGGSHYSLLYLIKALDRKIYEPIVMFYEDTPIIDRFNREHFLTTVFKKPLGKHFTPPHVALRIPYCIIRVLYNYTVTSFIPCIKFIFFIIRNDIQLIHLNNSAHVGGEWLIASKLLRRTCITHQRGFVNFSWLAKKRAKHFNKIICISKSIQTLLHENNIINNTLIIYNAIDFEDFRSRIKKDFESIKNEFGISHNHFLIGMVGNFQEWKGQHILLKAIEILRKKYPELVCLFIGEVSSVYKKDKDYFDGIKKEITRNGLEKNIIITGYRSDIPDLINSLDVMIHSSIKPEPFGRVILEGMCLKKSVIATAIGGPKEIIEHGISGILVPPREPNTLAEKIDYLLQHPAIRDTMGDNALKRVVTKFGLEQFSREINNLYHKLLAE